MEHADLHLSNSAPLNPAGKPLPLLARDLEAEPPAGVKESGSIRRKSNQGSSLADPLAIIHLTEQYSPRKTQNASAG
jgi:hypothetical protein